MPNFLPGVKNSGSGSCGRVCSARDRRPYALGHLIAGEIAVPVRFVLGGDNRCQKLGPGLLLALQEGHPGRDHVGDGPVATSGDGLGGEAFQLGWQGHGVHGGMIGAGDRNLKRSSDRTAVVTGSWPARGQAGARSPHAAALAPQIVEQGGEHVDPPRHRYSP